MNIPKELEQIRDEHARTYEVFQGKEKTFSDGFDLGVETISKSWLAPRPSTKEALKFLRQRLLGKSVSQAAYRIIDEEIEKYQDGKESLVQLADVQILLDALKQILRDDPKIGNRSAAYWSAHKALKTFAARTRGEGKE